MAKVKQVVRPMEPIEVELMALLRIWQNKHKLDDMTLSSALLSCATQVVLDIQEKFENGQVYTGE